MSSPTWSSHPAPCARSQALPGSVGHLSIQFPQTRYNSECATVHLCTQTAACLLVALELIDLGYNFLVCAVSWQLPDQDGYHSKCPQLCIVYSSCAVMSETSTALCANEAHLPFAFQPQALLPDVLPESLWHNSNLYPTSKVTWAFLRSVTLQ
eukprot:5731884-Amphidinium_carterae.1